MKKLTLALFILISGLSFSVLSMDPPNSKEKSRTLPKLAIKKKGPTVKGAIATLPKKAKSTGPKPRPDYDKIFKADRVIREKAFKKLEKEFDTLLAMIEATPEVQMPKARVHSLIQHLDVQSQEMANLLQAKNAAVAVVDSQRDSAPAKKTAAAAATTEDQPTYMIIKTQEESVPVDPAVKQSKNSSI